MGNKQSWAMCGKVCLRCVTCQCGPTKEEQELSHRIGEYGKTGDNAKEEHLKLILDNISDNFDLWKRIDAENEIFKEKMKNKIYELIARGINNDNPPIIGTGNSCNNPCYIYNIKITSTCPKCGGRIKGDKENDYELGEKWDERTGTFEKYKKYNESKICTAFRWNNNIDIWDVDMNECCKHYDKVDPQKKEHIIVKTKEGQKEFDVPYHYMMIDGERFDFPFCMNMFSAIFHNDPFFFPRQGKGMQIPNTNMYLSYGWQPTFFYEQNRIEMGQSIGIYGLAWRHEVTIFTCNSCGHKFHVVKSSPFAFRNKSLDV